MSALSMQDDFLFRFKVHCFSRGLRLDPAVVPLLTRGGDLPLTIHEYATTGGVTLRIGDVYLNAPFDEWWTDRSEAVLAVSPEGGTELRFRGEAVPCEVLPLPGYLDEVNAFGSPVVATTMSHCDRIRVSPIGGCVLDCAFCDMPADRYRRTGADEVLASVAVAQADRNLPAHHMLISGGSPGPRHFQWFDETLAAIAQGTDLPTDVMMSPREGSADHVGRLARAGVRGFSLNLEVFGDAAASAIMPRKHERSTPYVARTVEAALEAVGGDGRVRSLVIVGLDDRDSTLAGIEFLARMGCEPVLSPFRPAQGTKLMSWEPPSEDFLVDVFLRAQEIVDRYGLRLGPRCIPCQHNTLTFPDGSDAYWYSSDRASAAL
ncbi:hypothetical protein E4P40_25000 [Blastococcus sp. CT_GayMR20]|uniref:radical SAM protein n=1 Tax=Blastococcus sp. CT_GayMR20 TaxID=2559609 RepID=UPI0010734504|nr:radical SAM protein [Blastococcus sp. CT_GayMR20]TFV66834.1 hypothetical protein E4P40_25000 [Blastococcus sp. CT_GayMR20]